MTSRSRAMPTSLAARKPNPGKPATASHEPAADAPTTAAKATDIAAAPLHPMMLPRVSPASGKSGLSTACTGNKRSRANETGATVVTSWASCSWRACDESRSIGAVYRTCVRYVGGLLGPDRFEDQHEPSDTGGEVVGTERHGMFASSDRMSTQHNACAWQRLA